MLFLLCKEGMEKGAIREATEDAQVMNRHTIGAAILSEPVVYAIRKILHRMMSKIIELDDVRTVLKIDVLKRDAIEGEEAKKAKAKVAKALKKTPRKRKK